MSDPDADRDVAGLILHHYDFSNFSEKVRLVLGHKKLNWHSVTIPAYEPKPDYVPLTAGYRRTPALQIGADIYCDTRLIIEELEHRFPTPSIYPNDSAALRARCDVLIGWAEQSLMRPLALYISGAKAADFPDAFHADRARLHGKRQPTVEQVQASSAKYRMQTEIQLRWIEDLLSDGSDYVLEEGVSVADIALYEAPWFLKKLGGESAIPDDCKLIRAWMQRVAQLGHGRFEAMSPDAALDIARNATASKASPAPHSCPEGIEVGERVTVGPFDQQSPATGELVAVTSERISIRHEHPRCGAVMVHFPRLGYRLGRARTVPG